MPIKSLVKTLLVLILFLGIYLPAQSETAEELAGLINEQNSRIQELEAEIKQYEQSLNETQKTSQTLSSTVKSLDTTRKKLETRMNQTEHKITSAAYTILKLDLDIANRARTIDVNLAGLTGLMQKMNEEGDRNLLEIMLEGSSISEAFGNISEIEMVNENVQLYLLQVRKDKAAYEAEVAELTGTKRALEKLERSLTDEKRVTDGAIREKADLLLATKNREAEYKKILDEKIALKEAFEEELHAYETKLRFTLDPSSVPKAGSGGLSWPLANVMITQEFGDTAFSRTNAYSGKGHNGIDLRASIGTEILSAGSGVIAGVGNTDIGCPRGSYGKWVLITHDNGLSTLYAHLSLIKANTGARVTSGEIIGYSGNTGYSTGPHLHFSVYASGAVTIGRLTRSNGKLSPCSEMPLSALNGYLNPLSYLPQ